MIIVLVISFIALLFCIIKNLFIGIGLSISLILFLLYLLKNEFSLKNLFEYMKNGAKKSYLILIVFVLIGSITSLFMSAGTIPSFVYYGVKYMNPIYFYLYVFIITSIVSILLGTSLGTVATIGIAFIIIAKEGNANIAVTTGAIISAAYVGDRCSFMSSSAILVANITDTKLRKNIFNMIKTSIIPYILTVVIFGILSKLYPLESVEKDILININNTFKISYYNFLPAFVIIFLIFLKFNVKKAMLGTIIFSIFYSIFIQGFELNEIIKIIYNGFYLPKENALYFTFKGGGIISMLKASYVVFISCIIAGLIEGSEVIDKMNSFITKITTRKKTLILTFISSFITSMFGCSQTISVVLTETIVKKQYERNKISNYLLAIDLENTAILLAAIIPWNIAAYVPTQTLNVNMYDFIPYAVYLYILPLTYLVTVLVKKVKTP